MKRIANPPNPYDSTHHEWLEPPPEAALEVFEERASSILSENKSPDVPFRWSANPYRGCQHACAYCYARTTHEYLGFGAGTDFDTKIVVKTNAAELLDAAFSKRSWRREFVNFSGVTDCYQPLEASYGLMRACLDVCIRHRNPAAVVTKGYLVVRDIERLVELQRVSATSVFISIPFAKHGTSRLIEPQAPPPGRRFEAVRALADAGIPVGVFIAPIIPGLNDRDIPDILRRAADAGARTAAHAALHLSGNVAPVFLSRVKQAMPLRAERIESRIRDTRGGQLCESRFGHRMTGQGPYWESISALFAQHARRCGLLKPDTRELDDRSAACGETRTGRSADRQLAFDFGESRRAGPD